MYFVPTHMESTTVLVMKAVGDHLVLTFCQNNGFLETITVSRRQHVMTAAVSFHFLIEGKNLKIISLNFFPPGFSKYSFVVGTSKFAESLNETSLSE